MTVIVPKRQNLFRGAPRGKKMNSSKKRTDVTAPIHVDIHAAA
jgi:hypothetical protein